MIYAGRSDMQLHTLITKLSSHIDHTDYLGTIIGYSVVGGLIGFKTSIGSNPNKSKKLNPQAIEQFKFEEIRSVYSKVGSTLDAVIDQDASRALSQLIYISDKKITSLFDEKTLIKEQSVLLKNIFANIDSQKNYTDILRRKGIKLISLVKEKGSFVRPYDFLTEDYRSIIVAFAPKTIYTP